MNDLQTIDLELYLSSLVELFGKEDFIILIKKLDLPPLSFEESLRKKIEGLYVCLGQDMFKEIFIEKRIPFEDNIYSRLFTETELMMISYFIRDGKMSQMETNLSV
ncbi:MAG: hypothetical protein CME70_03165 [Halobacteriovorax sp.]|nr:hypothetical protein [Halobacteriovorax sp.]MBK22983.1 hypothetical protein [Halobacteriovorax sp.]|tara:strand:+ start:13541 stop:13858 length:318 start_codon:yes stop_codon:yes gene_type:complete